MYHRALNIDLADFAHGFSGFHGRKRESTHLPDVVVLWSKPQCAQWYFRQVRSTISKALALRTQCLAKTRWTVAFSTHVTCSLQSCFFMNISFFKASVSRKHCAQGLFATRDALLKLGHTNSACSLAWLSALRNKNACGTLRSVLLSCHPHCAHHPAPQGRFEALRGKTVPPMSLPSTSRSKQNNPAHILNPKRNNPKP